VCNLGTTVAGANSNMIANCLVLGWLIRPVEGRCDWKSESSLAVFDFPQT